MVPTPFCLCEPFYPKNDANFILYYIMKYYNGQKGQYLSNLFENVFFSFKSLFAYFYFKRS